MTHSSQPDASRIRDSQLAVYASLVLVALVAATPLWGPGMVNTRGGGDSPFLLQRAHQMVVNLRAGVFPVRWMPDAAYGLGYPFFSYYAALPYYLTGLLALAGLDLLTALKLVQTLGFVAAALAMYDWMHGVTRNCWAAWLAAVAYTIAPFHLVNVYVRGDSLSEFYAFIFYPLILRGLDRISDPQSPMPDSSPRWAIRWLWPALAYAGLILTHNLSALMLSPFVLLYPLILILRTPTGRWHVLTHGVLALGFGVLLAAWYWLPALAELGQVQLGPSTEDFFHYGRHFRTLNLVQDRVLFDYSIAAEHSVRSPFAMGLAQAAFAVLGALALLVRGLQRRRPGSAEGWPRAHLVFVLLGLLISTAMITPLSKPLWDHLPLLPVIQFPWRFLSAQALFAAAATAALLPDQLTTRNLQSALIALPVAALLIASVLIPLHPKRLFIGPADVTTERLQLYELFTGNIGTTIRYEWLPNTVIPRPFTSNALIEPDVLPQAIPLDGAALEATLAERGPTRQVWRVWGEGGAIALPLLHWPGWGARVDGEPVQVWPVEGSGYLALEVPPGEHIVLLQLGRTPVRAGAEMASLCALITLLVVLLHARRQVPRLSVVGRRSLVIFSLIVLPLLALLLLLRKDFDSNADLTMDFHRMPYLHHNPDGVDFGGVARLAGYTLSAKELAPGDTLTVTLDWSRAEGAYTATVRLLSPAAVRHEVEPLAEGTCNPQSPAAASGASCDPIAIQLPEDIPRGIYLLQLDFSERVLGQAREDDSGAPLSETRVHKAIYLQPVRVPRGPSLPRDASVLASFGPAIRLYAATVTQPAPKRLAVQLEWSAVRPVAGNCGISLRLLDADGQHRIPPLDTQPGYGFLPTSLWRPGDLITDRYTLALPGDLPPDASYYLEIVLYEVSMLEAWGQTRLGDFALPMETGTAFEARRPPRIFSLPFLQHPLGVEFGEEVRLAGYDLEQLEQGEEALRLTLWWQALQRPQADYTVFVHLFDPATEDLPAQSDAQPRDGAYPTSWWAEGEVVSETVTLSLGGVPEGTYRLAVGLYDWTVTRLPAIGPDGQRLPDDRVILPMEIGRQQNEK